MPQSENKSNKGSLQPKEDSLKNSDSEYDHLEYNYSVDATDLSCPLPLLKMKQCLNKADRGEVIFILATHPASQRDFQAYIDMTAHQMLMQKSNNQFLYWITKA